MLAEKLLTWEKTSDNTWLSSEVYDGESYSKRWKIVHYKGDNTINVYEYDVSKDSLFNVKNKVGIYTIDEALLWVDERLSRTQQVVGNRINESYKKQIQSIDERLLRVND